MNITLLWLLLTGKLEYLRQGWLRTQKVDPLRDYLLYRIKLWTFRLFSVAVILFACAGEIHLVEQHLYRDLTAIIFFFGCMLAPLGTFLGGLSFVIHYEELVKPHWYKGEQFVSDIWRLLHVVSGLIDGELDILAAPDYSTRARNIPKEVANRLIQRIRFRAKEAVRHEIDKGYEWQSIAKHHKSIVKECWELGQRLGILDGSYTLQKVYSQAQDEIYGVIDK